MEKTAIQEAIEEIRLKIYNLWAQEEAQGLEREEALEIYETVADNVKFIKLEDYDTHTLFYFTDFTFYGHITVFILLKDKAFIYEEI